MCVWIILFFGISKFLDLPAFRNAISSWTLVPSAFTSSLTVGVPALEVSLSLCWIAGMRRREAHVGLVCFVIALTIVFVTHWVMLKKPECGRLGLMSKYFYTLEEGRWVLARNCIIVVGLAAGLLPGVSTIRFVMFKKNPGRIRTRAGLKAFTLIEVLLVLALIGMLIVLLTPVLSKMRQQSRITVSLSNLRSHAANFTAYSSDFKDVMPYATVPTATSVVRCLSRRIAVTAEYFDMSNLWFIALSDGYYDGNPWSRSFASPLNRFRLNAINPILGTEYYYSCAFLASPEFYDPLSRRNPPIQLRAVRASEVLFPSSKTVHAEFLSPEARPVFDNRETTLAGFCDGHATKATANGFFTCRTGDGPASIGQNSPRGYGGHFPGMMIPLSHTLQGVRGRDVP